MENKVFESVSRENIKYSAFDLSHEKKLSCQMGQLIPVLLQEIVPGDMFRVTTEVMLRLSPTLTNNAQDKYLRTSLLCRNQIVTGKQRQTRS